jgi:site-specific DNA-methyltransferase (adenine-specific)
MARKQKRVLDGNNENKLQRTRKSEDITTDSPFPGYLADTAYVLPENITFEEWQRAGTFFQKLERSLPWYIGDWWNFGENKFNEDAAQGIRDVTGYAFETMRVYSWVCRKFPPSERRADIPFTHYLELARQKDKNPEAVQAILEEIAEQGIIPSKRQLPSLIQVRSQSIKEAKQSPRVEEAEIGRSKTLNRNGVLANILGLWIKDAKLLTSYVEKERIHLTVTSPPYNLDKLYRAERSDNVEYGAWFSTMLTVFEQIYQVTAPGGRLAVNVPLDTFKGGIARAPYVDLASAAASVGWNYRFTIVWNEGNVSNSKARGSIDSASAPNVIAPVEMIPVFYKGDQWKRIPSSGQQSDLGRENWLKLTNGLWTFSGESNAWEGHPAAFPVDLPLRLIKLLSFPMDVILDPFMGSGTTAIAALATGRQFIGVDIEEAYVDSTARRIDRYIKEYASRAIVLPQLAAMETSFGF